MPNASERQVGGDHYKSDYQHWDWAIDINLGYLESAATKYVSRWRQKNGVQDVEKAIHYMEKAKEAFSEKRYYNDSTLMDGYSHIRMEAVELTDRFYDSNDMSELEKLFMIQCASWETEQDIDEAIITAQNIIDQAAAPLPPGKATMASDGPLRTHNAATEGMEHPFGYEGEE